MGKRKSAEEKKATKDARNEKRREKRRIEQVNTHFAEPGLPSIVGVDISELTLKTRFELEGDLLEVHSIEKDGIIIANKLECDPSGEYMIPRWQRPVAPGTVVTLK